MYTETDTPPEAKTTEVELSYGTVRKGQQKERRRKREKEKRERGTDKRGEGEGRERLRDLKSDKARTVLELSAPSWNEAVGSSG